MYRLKWESCPHFLQKRDWKQNSFRSISHEKMTSKLIWFSTQRGLRAMEVSKWNKIMHRLNTSESENQRNLRTLVDLLFPLNALIQYIDRSLLRNSVWTNRLVITLTFTVFGTLAHSADSEVHLKSDKLLFTHSHSSPVHKTIHCCFRVQQDVNRCDETENCMHKSFDNKLEYCFVHCLRSRKSRIRLNYYYRTTLGERRTQAQLTI